MNVVGIPVGGLKTVGQIVATNTLTFKAGQNGSNILALVINHLRSSAMRPLSSFPNERAFITSNSLRVGPMAAHSSTTIADAAQRMDEQCVLNLPVEKAGKVAYSVSRHDLLRAWIGLGVGMGLDP